jgi:CheY-like chemotaxis protein
MRGHATHGSRSKVGANNSVASQKRSSIKVRPKAPLVLVIEPDDLVRELIARGLDESGCEVVALASDRDAATSRAFDLVIVDIAEPRDAGEMVRSLKQRFAAPVVATSARFGRSLALSQQAAGRFGVCALLPKPFKREELITAVKAALGAAGDHL